MNLFNISMICPMYIEKIATPKNNTNAPIGLSISFLGCKSPNPTVDREVKAK